MLKTQKPQTSRRRVLAAVAGATAAASLPISSAAASNEAEWSEFQRWYELTLEEQRIYDQHDGDTVLLDAMNDERNPLEAALLAREPQTLQHFAMLAVVELRYAEKRSGLPWVGHLSFGVMQDESPGWVQGANLIERILKLALAKDLLPSVMIHGEGGNA